MEYALPVCVAVFAWWASTVAVMFRAGLPESSYLKTLAGANLALAAGLICFFWSLRLDGAIAAYLGFFAGLLVWMWHEVTYLFGFVSGPRPEPCPPDVRGWARFVRGVETCVYHELAIVATALVLAVMSMGSSSKMALWTFSVLWVMRWSVKLNIFLGVRNLHMEYLPQHLAYLESFVRRRSMNELFPLSILLSVSIVLLLVSASIDAPAGSQSSVSATLLATLLVLAILEHVLLVVDLDDSFLWRIGMRSRGDGGAPSG